MYVRSSLSTPKACMASCVVNVLYVFVLVQGWSLQLPFSYREREREFNSLVKRGKCGGVNLVYLNVSKSKVLTPPRHRILLGMCECLFPDQV